MSSNPYFRGHAQRHTSTLQVLRWFEFAHLPDPQANLSRSCAVLAERMVNDLPDSPELTAGLRKLLEAKDCFVRASIAAGS